MGALVSNTKIQFEADYIPGGKGQLFCVVSRPIKPEARTHHTVLVVPPFAEEMNRSRRFLALLRKQISSTGPTVLQVDLFGTGDSAGDYADATIQTWLDDLIRTIGFYQSNKGGTLSVLGVRSGCLLISELFRRSDYTQFCAQIGQVVYVQPEISGYDVINKMLRVRVAAKRFAGDRSETTEILWSNLEAGGSVDVSGYSISSTLALEMRDLSIEPQAPPALDNSRWLSLMEDDEISSINSLWQAQQINTRPFWQLHDYEPESHVVQRIAKYFS